jgi:hypothetical protein
MLLFTVAFIGITAFFIVAILDTFGVLDVHHRVHILAGSVWGRLFARLNRCLSRSRH